MSATFLLICYSYPPYPGTGGRRWAKLSKYLAKEGNTIHVINAANTGNIASLWEKDTSHAHIKLHSIVNNAEAFGKKIKPGILSKAVHKGIHWSSRLRTNANYADQSLWWSNRAYAKAKEILNQHSINYVIVSCPPYHAMDRFATIKTDFPKVKFILDYRDIWTIKQKGKGFFSHLSDQRFSKEQEKELNALKAADYVFTVADEMTVTVKEHFPDKPVFTIPNGFDEDDYVETMAVDSSTYIKKDKVNILFAGSLVQDSNAYAIPFFTALAKLKETDVERYSRIHLCILGNVNADIKHLIQKYGLDVVSFFPPLSSKAIGRLYPEFDYLLLFLIPYYTYAFISKFFDYLPARKPIISVSEQGSFSEFLEKNNLGKNIDPEHCYEAMQQVLSQKEAVNINTGFEISKFSYRESASQLLRILDTKNTF